MPLAANRQRDMTTLPAHPNYPLREEIASSVMHGIGTVLAIAAFCVLVGFAARYGNVWHVVSCSTFGVTLILCFTTSTLYHSIHVARIKPVLRALDHAAIFLLIAGTYTPFMLVNLNGPWGWSLFAVIWSLAILGIGFRLLLNGRLHGVVVTTYLAMGWAVVVAVKPMLQHVAQGGLLLLAAGGLAYTAGVIFYKWHRLPYNHAIWHGFVLSGAALHFFAVLFYVIPWPENSI